MADLLNQQFLITTLVAAILLALIGAVMLRRRGGRRSQALFEALRDSTRHQVVPRQGPSAAGFAGRIEPAPEPFLEFTVAYGAATDGGWQGRLADILSPRADRLAFTARLPRRPDAEIVWRLGQIPGRALARRERASLWIQRRLDIVDAEYAVRGVDTVAVEHVFFDLQARFRPFLEVVSVQADDDPEVRIILRTRNMSFREIPALVLSVRALGRAVLQR